MEDANDPATGAPSISGAAQVGGTLTAVTTDIADQDGLPASFNYQWLRMDGSNHAHISGANKATYEQVAADLGKTLEVWVSFTDNGGSTETVMGSAMGTVVVPSPSGVETWKSDGVLTLSWNSVPVATSYQYRYTVNGVTTGPTEVPIAGTRFTLSDLDLSQDYAFQVYALYYNTWSAPSLEVRQTVNTAPAFKYGNITIANENQTYVNDLVATDSDSEDSVTGFAITGGADRDKFTITNESIPRLDFKMAPDYENPQDVASADPMNAAGNNEYVVELTVTSGAGSRALTATQTITVQVCDVHDAGNAPPTATFATMRADEYSLISIHFGQWLHWNNSRKHINLANSSFTVKKTPAGGTEETVPLRWKPQAGQKDLVLYPAQPVLATDTNIKVSYTKPTTGTNNKLVDEYVHEIDSFTDYPVSNIIPLSASRSGNTIRISFNRNLAAAANLANSSFTVRSGPDLSTTVINNSVVILTLESALTENDTYLEVSYTKPTTGTNNKLIDTYGDEVPSFTVDWSNPAQATPYHVTIPWHR